MTYTFFIPTHLMTEDPAEKAVSDVPMYIRLGVSESDTPDVVGLKVQVLVRQLGSLLLGPEGQEFAGSLAALINERR